MTLAEAKRQRIHRCHFGKKCWCLCSSGAYTASKGSWPLVSDAAGVHPSQIPAAMEEADRLGVRMEYTKNGSAIFETPRDRKKYLRAIGLQDKSAFC